MDRFDEYRRAWERYLLGEAWDPRAPRAGVVLDSMERMAFAEETQPGAVFVSPFIQLRAQAMLWRTPGSSTYGDAAEGQRLLQAFDALYESDFGGAAVQRSEDWWLFEVGIPMRVLDILILLYDIFPDAPAAVNKWTDVILAFKDEYQKSSHGKAETGANLVWKCHVLLLTGILRRDQTLLDWVNAQLPTVFTYSRSVQMPRVGTVYPDGFYPDGSFVQHYFIAYNGGYGKHLLAVTAGLLYAFRHCSCLDLPPQTVEFFMQAVRQSYLPLLYRGHCMDVARGREVSRWFNQDDFVGRVVMRALCYLAAALPQARRELCGCLWRWMPKESDRKALFRDETSAGEYYVQPSLVEVVAALEAAGLPALEQPSAHYNFGVMCKAVHHEPNWAAAVSMYGQNIACYEALNGESRTLWHISDGVTYLYTGAGCGYCRDYYAAVDPMRLPGITVDRDPDRARAPLYGWYLPESKNVYAFAGGVQLGAYGSAGMQYRGQGCGKERSLEAKKSWFFLGDAIVCLGSGITSDTGHEVETVVLNEMTEPGQALFADPAGRYLHLRDIGVVLPQGGDLHTLQETRTGSWNRPDIDPAFCCTRGFATAWLAHGRSPRDARYAYILLPARTQEQTRAYAADPDAEVLRCDDVVHAVRCRATGVTGLHFWQESPAGCAGVCANTQACVLLAAPSCGWQTVVLSDPTKLGRTITLTFTANALRVEGGACLRVKSLCPLCLEAQTAGLDGRPLTARIQWQAAETL